MKLTVGLGSVDEYIRFSEAGADEFFCGMFLIPGRRNTTQ